MVARPQSGLDWLCCQRACCSSVADGQEGLDDDVVQGELTISREKLVSCEKPAPFEDELKEWPVQSKAAQHAAQRKELVENDAEQNEDVDLEKGRDVDLEQGRARAGDTPLPEGPWHTVVPIEAGHPATLLEQLPEAVEQTGETDHQLVPLPPLRSRSPAAYNMEDDAEDIKNGLAVRLPNLSRHSVASNNIPSCCCCCVEGREKKNRCLCLEDRIVMTAQEMLAFKRLSQLADIHLDEDNPRHVTAMKDYWHYMLGEDAPYEAPSPRWSDDLGFQGKTPWTDFRGGGLLALRCLLYMAERHTEKAHQLAERAKFSNSAAWYPFSAVGITICQMLAVHLRLHARPAVGPIRQLPPCHVLALKRFVRELVKGDPVVVFARYWMAAVAKVDREWQEICRRDSRANVLVSFNQVYRYVGIAIESTFAWRSRDHLNLLDTVNTRAKSTRIRNAWSRASVGMIQGLLELEDLCCCRRRRGAATSASSGGAAANDMRPPELLTAADVSKLYRGVAGIVEGQMGSGRMWVDFVTLQLRWACKDLPAHPSNRMSLFSITWCQCRGEMTADHCQLDIFSTSYFGQKVESLQPPAAILKPKVSITCSLENMQYFLEAMQKLLGSRDQEGHGPMNFVSKRLFQYLWVNQRMTLSQDELYESQAVLAFNLDPKDGVAYLKTKLRKQTDDEVGEWLAHVCMEKGGLDPTMLGNYFSRKDTLQVFRQFVRRIDFRGLDILDALRLMFDTFKPGGEGQVITRILEYFAESYYQTWLTHKEDMEPRTAYKGPDSVEQIAVSLIMLNTGIHIAPVKCGSSKSAVAVMTPEQYIKNTRFCVDATEAPDEALNCWYEKVTKVQISVEPIPRAPFSKLPVQPDMEGRLIAVLNAQAQKRYWAVLVLGRLYLFTDECELDPEDVIDLKEILAHPVSEHIDACQRFRSDLRGISGCFSCCRRRQQNIESEFVDELRNAEDRAFEVLQHSTSEPSLLQKSWKKPRAHISFVCESPDLMEKWVNHICP